MRVKRLQKLVQSLPGPRKVVLLAAGGLAIWAVASTVPQSLAFLPCFEDPHPVLVDVYGHTHLTVTNDPPESALTVEEQKELDSILDEAWGQRMEAPGEAAGSGDPTATVLSPYDEWTVSAETVANGEVSVPIGYSLETRTTGCEGSGPNERELARQHLLSAVAVLAGGTVLLAVLWVLFGVPDESS